MAEEKGGRALVFILGPMIATFVCQRIYLHHSSPDSHVFVGGYLVHHLFTGVLIQVPAAVLLAFGMRGGWPRDAVRAAFGAGTAMMLDEVIYLIATDGSGVAYRSTVSLWGAVVLEALAGGFIVLVHLRARGTADS